MISAKNRFNSWKKALRKKKIDEAKSAHPMYDNLHQYSKNSIHRDCSSSKNYSISDQRKLERMAEEK